MRPIWKGTLVVGQVAIPVGLQLAAAREESSFRSLHRACGTPIRQERYCPSCEVKLASNAAIARGFEFATGQFVVFEDGALGAALQAKTLELDRFVALSEVREVYVDRTHWLVPADEAFGERAYARLLQALEQTGLGGLGRICLFTKELVGLVRPLEGVLALQTLFTDAEVRSPEEFAARIGAVEASPEELAAFVDVVAARMRRFSAKWLAISYPPRLPALVEAKVEGGAAITVPEPEHAAPRDLVAALKASVRRSTPQRRRSRRASPAKR